MTRHPKTETVASPYGLTKTRTALAVVLLLAVHYALAFDSLRRENPTVDEVAHLPAGISYWQKGTFKLYHHNPPLSKLVAAIPALLLSPETAGLYTTRYWTTDPPSHPDFALLFAYLNRDRYLELFTVSRMVMPLFSVVGGLFVFAWSSRLYGRLGGLLSLAMWCLCPNILAHARLITSDVAGAAMAVGATYLFWRYLRQPSWKGVLFAGVALGLAQLTKFSLLLLYGYWPLLWLARLAIERNFAGWPRRFLRDAGQGGVMVAISLATICVGYGFEGVGKPLGSYELASQSLTRPITPGELAKGRPRSANRLLEVSWQHRINRFRDTWLDRLPVPLPAQFVLGFDDQKVETEGLPAFWLDPNAPPGEKTGYPVYLDGEMRRTGWWYYYLACLVYKVPEGTWLLVALSFVALVVVRRDRAAWFDEVAVLAFPAIMLFVMSALTDINLGIRYVLSIFPFVFIATGKLVPWLSSLRGKARRPMAALVVVGLGLTTLQTALIHPSYLATFNWLSGGPNRGPEHLIDSNLDWGQDLVTLKRWLAANRPGKPVGLAYFGQVNPNVVLVPDRDFVWFLPPARAGKVRPMSATPHPSRVGPSPRLTPGVYAISASFVRGLPFRLFDRGDPAFTWQPAWNAIEPAFDYFAELTPVARMGHSIYVYDVTQEQCDRINPKLLSGSSSRS